MNTYDPKIRHLQLTQELKARLAEFEKQSNDLRLLINVLENNPPK